ncbi:hypothetical protein SEA_NEDARYA_96 [Gordonia phage Nedarya]|nr:hypothetical protein SEA_NEDARYA_96 [Gordonia phage Nedarya]
MDQPRYIVRQMSERESYVIDTETDKPAVRTAYKRVGNAINKARELNRKNLEA